eukprot:CCRYP_014839-RF/>CCRYP_014839-RF protein AED:0.40 eAED:0.89 QI:0/-1/0/1/-1/0/1/0/59
MHKSHEHVFPLVARLQMSRSISNLLATWKTQLRQLLDQAPPHHLPPKHSQRIHCAIHHH